VSDIDTVMILVGGDPLEGGLLSDLPDPDFVIAADSGLDEAVRLGIPVDLVVGDLDSASDTATEAAQAAGIDFEIHPTDKEKTDLELALDRALEEDPLRIVVAGGTGGRLDHFLANAALLGSSHYEDVQIDWYTNRAHVAVVRDELELHGSKGDLVTILAHGGQANGVQTEGLRWNLRGDTLEPGSTRGVSNELRGPVARVRVHEGTLLVVTPRTSPES
jgi:thiamine pyrophosphokinase